MTWFDSGPTSTNASRGGLRKDVLTSAAPHAGAFPARMKNGTRAHRQLSISSRSATNISVSESGRTPAICR
jgi:hypothetical protein